MLHASLRLSLFACIMGTGKCEDRTSWCPASTRWAPAAFLAVVTSQWYNWSEKCLNPKPQIQAKLVLDFGHSAVILFLNKGCFHQQ